MHILRIVFRPRIEVIKEVIGDGPELASHDFDSVMG